MEEFKVIGIDLHPATEVGLLSYSEDVHFRKTLGFFNTNQHFLISTQFQAARGRSFESCLWIWIFFDRISKQNVPLRNKFLSFDQEMILSINLTAQSQWICLRLVGLFYTPHALKASEFFSYIYIVKEKKNWFIFYKSNKHLIFRIMIK